MQLTASTVTRLIEKIENRGFVKRNYVGRIAKVYPAKSGLDLQPNMKAAWPGLYKRYSDAPGKNSGARLKAGIYRSAQQVE